MNLFDLIGLLETMLFFDQGKFTRENKLMISIFISVAFVLKRAIGKGNGTVINLMFSDWLGEYGGSLNIILLVFMPISFDNFHRGRFSLLFYFWHRQMT